MKISKIVFSYEADNLMPASYIYLKKDVKDPDSGKAVRQIKFDEHGIDGNEGFKGEVVFDINEKGQIIGIEILGNVIPDSFT